MRPQDLELDKSITDIVGLDFSDNVNLAKAVDVVAKQLIVSGFQDRTRASAQGKPVKFAEVASVVSLLRIRYLINTGGKKTIKDDLGKEMTKEIEIRNNEAQ